MLDASVGEIFILSRRRPYSVEHSYVSPYDALIGFRFIREFEPLERDRGRGREEDDRGRAIVNRGGVVRQVARINYLCRALHLGQGLSSLGEGCNVRV